MADEIQPCQMFTCCNNKQKISHTEYLSNIWATNPSCNFSKVLRGTIDQDLIWKDHINNICHKANSVKGFLRRNLHQCPTSIKSNCYKTFVRPILEYAASCNCMVPLSTISNPSIRQSPEKCSSLCNE